MRFYCLKERTSYLGLLNSYFSQPLALIRLLYRESLDRDYDVRRENFNGFCDVANLDAYSPISEEFVVEIVTSATKFFLKINFTLKNTLEYQRLLSYHHWCFHNYTKLRAPFKVEDYQIRV